MKKRKQKQMKTYEVYFYDNFHYGDEDDYCIVGRFSDYRSAEYVAMDIVRRSLKELYKQGDTMESLYDRYMNFGDSPSIRGKIAHCDNCFLPSSYAKEWVPVIIKGIGE